MQSDTVTRCCRDALAYRQVTMVSCKHVVGYSDKMLQRCIDLQAGNDNKLETCSPKQ